MQGFDVVSRILFILFITDSVLAAPVLVRENRQACVDMVHIPKDVITVLGKRGYYEELKMLLDGYLGKSAESSDAHASSSSALAGHDHGSTNVVQAPASNPASPTASMQGVDRLDELPHTLAPTEHGSDHENKWPWAYPDTNFDWNNWANPEDPPLLGPGRPAPPKKLKYGYEVEHASVQQPDPGPSNPRLPDDIFRTWKPPILESSGIYPSSSNFDWGWGRAESESSQSTNLESPSPLRDPDLKDPDPNLNSDWGHAQSTNLKSPRPLGDPDPNFDWPGGHAQSTNLKSPRPLGDPDPNFDWSWGHAQSTNLKSPSSLRDPDPKDPDPNFNSDWGHAQSTNLNSPRPLRDPDPNFDWDWGRSQSTI